MTEDEIILIETPYLNIKEQSVIGLLYGSGMPHQRTMQLRIKDIESSQKRIKIYQGKGIKIDTPYSGNNN
ncbi:MAG: hypothetical protein IPO92_13850 [Saprospiraceae bacterium]|nr:hypothetical protein [Saprospiraceae bacterium]